MDSFILQIFLASGDLFCGKVVLNPIGELVAKQSQEAVKKPLKKLQV